MAYDETTKKFSTKRYKTCSDDLGDQDSVMSDVDAIEDGPGRDASSSANAARIPFSSSGKESQSKGSNDIKQPFKTSPSDISKTDVTMIDVGAEKSPLINATTLSLDIKPPRSKVDDKRYASDPRKMEKLHSFDHSENKEPFKA